MNFHCIDIDDSLFFLGIHVSMFDIHVIVGPLTALERSCSVTTCINNKILSRFLSSFYLDLSANSQTSITGKSFTFVIVLQLNGLITFLQSIADLRYLYHFLDLNLKLQTQCGRMNSRLEILLTFFFSLLKWSSDGFNETDKFQNTGTYRSEKRTAEQISSNFEPFCLSSACLV